MYWRVAVYLISLICLVWGSGFMVSKLLPPNPHRDGLPSGGQRIGYLERLLIFIFVMAGSYEAIGFLVTAKSILRFGESRKDRKYAEYVLLGTLASFCCATVIGRGCRQICIGLFGALLPVTIMRRGGRAPSGAGSSPAKTAW